MKKIYNLAWIEIFKYRHNGSTYDDYIINDTSSISITEAYYNHLPQSKEHKENMQIEIAFNELIETKNFIKKF